MNAAERDELEKWIEIIWEKARAMGLDPYPTHFEVVPDHVIYELGAYGLPARFSHWTFGRDYHRQKTGYEYGMSKIYEIVFNTDPTQAFLFDNNSMLSHKLVVAHVLGHSDFFRRNTFFRHTDRQMIEKVRLHAQRLYEYEQQYGPLEVERFLDAVLSIEEHFDPVSPSYREKSAEEYEQERLHPPERTSEYDDLWKLSGDTPPPPPPKPRKTPPEPEKDLLRFIRDHAPDLADWQRDVLNIVREEMLYFLPQMRTKIQNEGWACATGDSLVVTEYGLMRFERLAQDGKCIRVASGRPGEKHPITDFHIERSVPTIRITTKRGYSIEGALKHWVRLQTGDWRYLSEIQPGDRVELACGTEIWPTESYPIPPYETQADPTLQWVADLAGVSLWTVLRHRAGRKTMRADEIEAAIKQLGYKKGRPGRRMVNRRSLKLHCAQVDTSLAQLLGYFVGDGNITKSGICLTCGDGEHAERLHALTECVLRLPATLRPDHTATGCRWRIEVHSRELLSLMRALGLDTEARARLKRVPECILRSPRPVVAAFLAGYFDADGYAGSSGVILSTASEELARQTQALLLNFGILSWLKPQRDGCLQIQMRGAAAARFHREIGFVMRRKRHALETYVQGHRWYKQEETTDEVVFIEHRVNDVYDITVDESHTYVANGFVNHNSFWHERILTDLDLTSEEHLEFRRMHASVLSPGSKMSINPYYVGYQILHDIQRRWDGEADPDDPEEDWRGEVLARPQGQGLQKLFEVVEDESDVSFLRKYLTKKLVRDLDMYTYKLEEVGGELAWVVQETDWRKVRDALVDSMTNFGAPVVMVEDGDYNRHRELYLKHYYDGKPLDTDYTARTLKNIHFLWGRPVHLETVIDDEPVLLTCDGESISQASL